MEKLDIFFELLSDQRKHSLSEIAEKLGIPIENLKKVVQFFAREKILLYNEDEGTIKLSSEWSFLARIGNRSA